jgi:hypothetical protein
VSATVTGTNDVMIMMSVPLPSRPGRGGTEAPALRLLLPPGPDQPAASDSESVVWAGNLKHWPGRRAVNQTYSCKLTRLDLAS